MDVKGLITPDHHELKERDEAMDAWWIEKKRMHEDPSRNDERKRKQALEKTTLVSRVVLKLRKEEIPEIKREK